MEDNPFWEEKRSIEVFQNEFVDLTSKFSTEKRTLINLLAYSLPDWEWFIHELIFRVNKSASDNILINEIRGLDLIATTYHKLKFYYDLEECEIEEVKEYLSAIYSDKTWLSSEASSQAYSSISSKVFITINSIYKNLLSGEAI